MRTDRDGRLYVATRLGQPAINLLPRGLIPDADAAAAAQTIGARTEHLVIAKATNGDGVVDWIEHLGDQTFVPPLGPAGYPRQLDPDRQPFPASDGWLSIVAYTNGAWDRIFAVLGDPDFLNDARFADARLRFFNSAALYQRMAELTPRFTVEDLLMRLQAVDIPAQRVRDLNEVIADEHLDATGFFRHRSHPTEGDYIEMRPPVKFSDAPITPARVPPNLDENGSQIRQSGAD